MPTFEGEMMQALQVAPAESLEALARLPLFAMAPIGELADIAASARRRIYRRSQVIHHVDDLAGDVFVIMKGHVKHRLQAPDGRQITHSIQSPGNYFGMMSVLDGKRRAGDAVALTDCEVLVIDRDCVASFIARYPEARGVLLQRYVASSRRMESMLQDHAFLSVPMRLAKVLVKYGEHEDGPDSSLIVASYLNQTELAFLVGTSRESVNQSLKQFACWGWIENDRRNIRILDAQALQRFAAQ